MRRQTAMNKVTDKRMGYKRNKRKANPDDLEWPTMDPDVQAEWERRYMKDDWAGIPFQRSWLVATALASAGLKRPRKEVK